METQKNFFFEINKSYRPDLQLLRGLSVILVVFYHLNIAGFDNGYLGVDIFLF
jgi:peptidoglycan/LPS O-acetylase OafA/YrhL